MIISLCSMSRSTCSVGDITYDSLKSAINIMNINMKCITESIIDSNGTQEEYFKSILVMLSKLNETSKQSKSVHIDQMENIVETLRMITQTLVKTYDAKYVDNVKMIDDKISGIDLSQLNTSTTCISITMSSVIDSMNKTNELLEQIINDNPINNVSKKLDNLIGTNGSKLSDLNNKIDDMHKDIIEELRLYREESNNNMSALTKTLDSQLTKLNYHMNNISKMLYNCGSTISKVVDNHTKEDESDSEDIDSDPDSDFALPSDGRCLVM